MKFYRVKKLVFGARVDPQYEGKTLIAVPHQYLGKGTISAHFNGQHMTIKKEDKPLTWRVFDDKFGRGTTYRLMYFEWKPEAVEKYEYR